MDPTSRLDNGVKVTDGKAAIKIGAGIYPETPIVSADGLRNAKVDEDFKYIEETGAVYIQPTTGNLFEIHAYPDGSDSIKISFKYIPMKKGTYSFDVASLFYEVTSGKTRTVPYFDVVDNNGEELWRVSGMPPLTADNPSYRSLYYFAVSE